MRLWKSINGNRMPERPIPSRQIKDLLMDFDDIVYTSISVWLRLNPKKLPSYLCSLDLSNEARHWVMVLTRRGRLVMRFKRGNGWIPKQVRDGA